MPYGCPDMRRWSVKTISWKLYIRPASRARPEDSEDLRPSTGQGEQAGATTPAVSLWPPTLHDDFEQPDSGHGPMPANRGLTDPKGFGNLLMLQANEVAQLHDLRLQRIFLGQHVEGFIHLEKLLIFDGGGDPGFEQFHALLVATAFELTAAAGAAHQD